MIFSHVKYSVHIAIPGRGVEPLQGFDRTYAVFSRLSSEVIRLVQPLTHIQHEEASRGLSRPLLSSVSFSHMKEQKSRKNNGGQPRLPPLSLHRFCFREPLRKTLTAFFTVTFRIFWGHRCILNLPCILRTGVVHFRSPSHQPSTWDHSLQCRWLGESRPST